MYFSMYYSIAYVFLLKLGYYRSGGYIAIPYRVRHETCPQESLCARALGFNLYLIGVGVAIFL